MKACQRVSLIFTLLITFVFTHLATVEAAESYETIFTYRAEKHIRRVQNKIVASLRRAVPGSEVLAVFKHIKSMRITNEMQKAVQRGVNVRVILSYRSRNHASAIALKNILEDDLIICGKATDHKGCMSIKDNLNSFILFSELNNGLRNIVMQTSQDLFVTRKYENALIVNNDVTLYQAHKDYWIKMSEKKYVRTSYNIESGSNGSVLYMGTRQSGDDIYANLFDKIVCLASGNSSRSSLFIAMNYFTSSRDRIIEKLLEKSNQGCNINILMNKHDHFDRNSPLARSLVDSGIRLWLVPHVNSSYAALNGHFGSNPNKRKMVWTGSHRFTISSLKRSDSSFLRVVDDGVYSKYRGNWFNLIRMSESYRVRKDQKDIVTWNVLAEGAQKNGYLPWAQRKEGVIEKLLETDADVIGLQEVNSGWNQLDDLITGLRDKYNYCGGKVLNWYAITNPIFIRKGLDYDCTNGYYHPRSGGYNCNSAIIDGKDYYNCHFNWRGSQNYRTTIDFLNRTSGKDFVALGDFNFSIYHSRSKNVDSARLFSESINYFPYKEHERKLVDKIGVPKSAKSCAVRESLDWKSRSIYLSDHRLTKSTIFTCR